MSIKILLVEDNPDHVLLTERLLKSTGKDYDIESMGKVEEALKKIIKNDYDLILSDYRLPGASALDFLKKIKEKGKDIPFIVVTAAGSEKIAVELMKEGAYDYVVKDNLYEETLPMIIERSLELYNEKEKKKRAEQALLDSEEELRRAYIQLKATQEQLIQDEKLKAIGQLASGVAHEVRNPLGIIIQGVNYLERVVVSKKEEVVDTLNTIKESVNRADKIISSLLDFSKASKLDLKAEDVNSILEDSLTLVKTKFKFEDIEVIKETKKDIPKVKVDKTRLQQVFVNILLNAIQSMPEGGKVIIRSYYKNLKEIRDGIGQKEGDFFRIGEKAVIVEVEDTGSGIPEENLKRIFDPFFTTKGPRGGAGLGLSVTKNIINMHKSLIDIESKIGKGTKVIVILKIM